MRKWHLLTAIIYSSKPADNELCISSGVKCKKQLIISSGALFISEYPLVGALFKRL